MTAKRKKCSKDDMVLFQKDEYYYFGSKNTTANKALSPSISQSQASSSSSPQISSLISPQSASKHTKAPRSSLLATLEGIKRRKEEKKNTDSLSLCSSLTPERILTLISAGDIAPADGKWFEEKEKDVDVVRVVEEEEVKNGMHPVYSSSLCFPDPKLLAIPSCIERVELKKAMQQKMEKMQKNEAEKDTKEQLEEEKENSEKDQEKLEDEQKKALEQAEKKQEAFASYLKKKKIERSESNFKSGAKQRKVRMKENTESHFVVWIMKTLSIRDDLYLDRQAVQFGSFGDKICKHIKKSVKEASSSSSPSLISSANSGEAEVSQPYLPFPSTSASSSFSRPHSHSRSSKSSHSKPSSSTTSLSPSSTAVPTASSSSPSSSFSSISSSSSTSRNTSVIKQFFHPRQPLAQTHKKHSSHTLKPISITYLLSTLSQNASEIKRQKKLTVSQKRNSSLSSSSAKTRLTISTSSAHSYAVTYSSSLFSSSSSSSVSQEPPCSPCPTFPSFLHHWVGYAETCGQRSTMEDSVLLLPVDGWDIEKLVRRRRENFGSHTEMSAGAEVH
ncbi:uncharacterized protein MONOS_14139 [Monocercomonoides exilis]|uniref:uncharacterized protein n=1 Tax=Monocercomonoides exilis TaxID=2049356 RepID=UPI003559A64B|nr:hypothetical protein MONOS_14139 [Monocercomonoides exilis]|eukprot:MONOS_14139.1-p1 / transcript=MONOS_14139.1 / gene=MONOS_14139 / organism=Monocercomonoides_exilis_PA203 / gene_product=unspecified product / transcript_product=unspecified product / location=Mono_scaffold00944:20340-22686(-) / protein_length=559 / sequence_SO=supercontig / SO=protein_coding / is_pseudo=false